MSVMKELHNLTHKDLDGAVCSILVKEYCRQHDIEYRVYPVTYRTVDSTFKQIYMPSKTELFPLFVLTDISLEVEPGNIGDFKNLLLIDHHDKPKSLIKNQNCIIDGPAACKLTFDTMTRLGARYTEQMKSLVKFADDYDTWTHKYKLSKRLNQLYYLYSFNDFTSRFARGLEDLNSDETTFLKWKEQDIKKKCEALKIERVTDEIALVIANVDVDEVASYIYEHLGYKYVIVWKSNFAGVSIRSTHNAKEVSDFCKQQRGGGHKHAGAFVLFLNNIDEVADIVEKFIEYVES
jgi:oligoribonuclease NrnB/cAMP/cGMP phosphodiesterase (DHH superfamily)